MRTLVAGRDKPVLKAGAHRLRALGKPAKVALTACRRQRVTMLKALITHQQLWQPQEAPIA